MHQSAYRKFHLKETALLKVVTDETNDAGDHALLGLLDFLAAFDTVDHDVLVERLARTYGLRSTALDWLRSYLLDGRLSQLREQPMFRPMSSVTDCLPNKPNVAI